MTNPARPDGPAVDPRHLLVIGAGPGLDGAIGGWADHPGPAWGTVSLGKAALRPAATMLGAELAGDGIRVASITIAGQIQPGTPFSPDQIAEKYWSVVQSDGTWPSEFRFDGT